MLRILAMLNFLLIFQTYSAQRSHHDTTTTQSIRAHQQVAGGGAASRGSDQVPSEEVTIAEYHVTFTEDELDQDCYPTADAIKKLMRQYYISPTYNITVKIVEGGINTVKMYVVRVLPPIDTAAIAPEKNIFFLKISYNKNSTDKLKNLQKGEIAQKLLNARNAVSAQHKKDFPVMVWLEAIFTYSVPFELKQKKSTSTQRKYDTNSFGSPEEYKYTIEMTHAAQGETIYTILLDNNDTEIVTRCCFYLGFTLGNFQHLFLNYHNSNNPKNWTTACHNDLHLDNILFNPNNSQIYFIDNESFNLNEPIFSDFSKILENFSYGTMLEHKPYILRPFLEGYFDSYKDIKRKEQLKTLLLTEIDDIFYKDTKSLNTINEILESIIQKSVEQQTVKQPTIEQRTNAAKKIQHAWKKKPQHKKLRNTANLDLMLDQNASRIIDELRDQAITIVTHDVVQDIIEKLNLCNNNRLTEDDRLFVQGYMQGLLE